MIHPQTGPNADKSELIGSHGEDTCYSQTLTHSEKYWVASIFFYMSEIKLVLVSIRCALASGLDIHLKDLKDNPYFWF